MDEIFHFLVGLIISRLLTGNYIFLAGLFACLPDLIGALLFFSLDKEYSKLPLKRFIREFKETRKKGIYFSKIDFTIARYTHSLIACLIISLLSWLLFRNNFLLLTLSICSHVLVDMFVHIGEYQDTIFFPFSSFHLRNNEKAKKKIKFILWIILFFVFFSLEIIPRLSN